MATGAFGNIFGIITLWGIDISEWATLEFGLDILSNANDEDGVNRSPRNSLRNYELDDGMSVSASVGLSFRF